METTVLIMAQGEQRRLADLGYPKQLVAVDGEPILDRTLRLAAEFCPDHVALIIGRRELGAERPGLVTLTDPGHCVLDGIAQTVDLWGSGRVVVLLGDVVFSRAALWAIFADGRPFFFAGTPVVSGSFGELFALSFAADRHKRLAHLLETVPCRRTSTGTPMRYAVGQQGGHLRRLLWHSQNGDRRPRQQRYLEIGDWTDDIDEPSDLARLPDFTLWARAELGC